MEQKPSYVRISDLLKTGKKAVGAEQSKCDETLSLIAQTFHTIDRMTIAEREELLFRLKSWIIVEKFDVKGQSALGGFRRYCIADCLAEDPEWAPRMESIAPELFPSYGSSGL
jgi:hypothetical protein